MTDNPDPTPYRDWALYLASLGALAGGELAGTAPHVEVDYGAWPGVEVHVLAPAAYARPGGGAAAYGPGDLELGIKLRPVQQGARHPMIGTFLQFEVPIGDAARGLGTGALHAFIPLWVQITSGPWVTYGGAGYWINPGPGNRDYLYVGWVVQRTVTHGLALGAEAYYRGPDHAGAPHSINADVGAVIDVTGHHHILLSVGRSILGDTTVQWYAGYQLTL